ncbi:MAG: GvpL/GvpF family gas vesicle protein [Pseudomonadota bacterium]
MGGLYCFGLVASDVSLPPEPLPALPDDPPPVLIGSDVCQVIASRTTRTSVPQRRRYMRAHTRLLEVVGAHATVLPMRFGTIADDEPALREAIRPEAARIARLLETMEGQRAYGLSVRLTRERLVGRAMAARPDLRRERDRLSRQPGVTRATAMTFGRHVGDAVATERRRLEKAILAGLRPAVDDLVLRAPESDEQVLRAEIRLDRSREPSLDDVIQEIARQIGGDAAPVAPASGPADEGATADAPPAIRLVGPAPLYAFVDLRLSLDNQRTPVT